MVSAILFDDGKGRLEPLTDLRAAFDVRTGAFTMMERLARRLQAEFVALYVPDRLADVTRDRHALHVNELPQEGDEFLIVNGRCPFPPEEILDLQLGEAIRDGASGDLVAARLKRVDVVEVLEHGRPGPDGRESDQPVLLTRPWHARTVRDHSLENDLQQATALPHVEIPEGVTAIGDQPIRIHTEATVYPGVTLVAEDGPIVIERGATVRPGAVILGPTYVGRKGVVLEHALLGNSALGPWCKVGGEVKGCVFQGYSNKAHLGHLGDSWIGEWVNFGAGTTNSNLLNTYGSIIAQASPDMRREQTGETFLGAIVGDHVKFAINTRIMTGAIIHTGVMWAASSPVTGCVPRFAWETDAGRRAYRLDKFKDVARVVMGRRHVEPGHAYLDALDELAGA